MSRKRKTNPIEVVIDAVAMLPWWAGVAIAVVSYLVLHRLATPAAVTAVQPGQMSNLVAQAIVTAFASVGQYLVPFIGLVGAIISFVRRKQRAALVTDVAQAQSTHALDGMSWREFEILVDETFRLQSY